MKHLALGLAVALSGVCATAQALDGRYVGREALTLTRCGAYDGQSQGDWWVKIEAAGEQRVKLEGWASGGGGSPFSGKGELNGNALTAKVTGVNASGGQWSGTIEATFDSDRLVGRNAGPVHGSTCRFVSEFDTKRVN